MTDTYFEQKKAEENRSRFLRKGHTVLVINGILCYAVLSLVNQWYGIAFGIAWMTNLFMNEANRRYYISQDRVIFMQWKEKQESEQEIG